VEQEQFSYSFIFKKNMVYHSDVTANGAHDRDVLVRDGRARLALQVIEHCGLTDDGDGGLSITDTSGLTDHLLGEFFLFFSWAERRKLARSRDVNKAFAVIVLTEAGLLAVNATASDPLRIDANELQRLEGHLERG